MVQIYDKRARNIKFTSIFFTASASIFEIYLKDKKKVAPIKQVQPYIYLFIVLLAIYRLIFLSDLRIPLFAEKMLLPFLSHE